MMHEEAQRWVVRPRAAAGAAVTLIAIPFCGGAASVFHRFARRLPAWIDVLSVQLPGRATRMREAAYRSMQPLVADLTTALEAELRMPYAILGYSLGALIAFELARETRRRGLAQPTHLFALASGAPETRDPGRPIHALPDPEFLAEVGALNGTPREILAEAELMRALLPMLRADFTVHETYDYLPDAPLHCPISVLGGSTDPQVSRERLEGWCAHTVAHCSVRVVPGGHFVLDDAPDVVADTVTRELAPGDGSR